MLDYLDDNEKTSHRLGENKYMPKTFEKRLLPKVYTELLKLSKKRNNLIF